MSSPASQRKRRSQRSRSQRRQQRRHRRQRGGDASNWATSVYGPAGSHTAAAGSGNLIAAHNLSGVNMCTSGVAANAAPVVGGGVVPGHLAADAVKGPAASPNAAAATNQQPQMNVPGMPSSGGGRQNQRGGRGMLTDIAVPAVLLYANHMIKPRRGSTKKHGKRRHFSRKFRRY